MPNTEPHIYHVQTPSNYRETVPGMFQPIETVAEFRVDYSTVVDAAKKYQLSSVLNDMREQDFQIWPGRELYIGQLEKQPAVSPTVAYRYYYDASASDGVYDTPSNASEGIMVRSIDGSMVDRTNVIWHITVRCTLLGYHSIYDRVHANVITTSSVRNASAYRLGPDLKLLGDSSSSPKLGTATQVGGVIGTCTGSNATVGTFDASNWITYVKSTMDCGGEDVDINGQPINVPIEQVNHTLQFPIRRPYLRGIIPGGASSPSGYDTRSVNCLWELWGQYPEWCLNKRNGCVMFGFPVGQLVCTAVENTPIDEEFMMCSVTLTWDEWHHGEQAPWGFEGNIPPKAENTTGGADRPILNADTVYWINPHQEAFCFSEDDFPYGAFDLFAQMILPPT